MPRTRAQARTSRTKSPLEFTRTLTPAANKNSRKSRNAKQKKLGETFRHRKPGPENIEKKIKSLLNENDEPFATADQENVNVSVECKSAESNLPLVDNAYQYVETITKDEAAAQLREFDFTYKYGPCTNITRLQRFVRAEKLGMQPPVQVKLMLEKFVEIDETMNHSVWSKYSL